VERCASSMDWSSITAEWLAAERTAIAEDEGGKGRSSDLIDGGSGYGAVLIRGMTTIYKKPCRESGYRGGYSPAR